MLLRPLALNFFLGFALLALGIVPGPLAGLRDGLQKLRDLDDLSDLRLGARSQESTDYSKRLPGQLWLAIAGPMLMALSAIAWLYQ